MPDRAYLHPIDPELLPGARNAIDTCLRLKPQERITIITDTVTRGIAAALQSEVERVGSEYSLFVLEHHARRPLSFMPEIVLDDLALSQVSIFAAQTQPGELGARTEMTAVVNHHRIRHAHMVNINRQIMVEGMRADFCAVDKLSQRLVEHARQVDRITCKTPHGTEFEAELSPKLKWLKTSGLITRDKWGNLPGVRPIPLLPTPHGHRFFPDPGFAPHVYSRSGSSASRRTRRTSFSYLQRHPDIPVGRSADRATMLECRSKSEPHLFGVAVYGSEPQRDRVVVVQVRLPASRVSD